MVKASPTAPTSTSVVPAATHARVRAGAAPRVVPRSAVSGGTSGSTYRSYIWMPQAVATA